MRSYKNKKSNLVQVRISERESFMLAELCERFGKNASEMIRTMLSERHAKVFPAYMARKVKPLESQKEPDLTPEQACEKAGGKVDVVNGVPMCIIQLTSSMQKQVPLSKPELFKK